MKDYKRLTKRTDGNHFAYSERGHFEVVDRLCELEDKIEQGLILELPCKVGDIVYRVLPTCDNISRCDDFDQHICSRTSCSAFIREEKFAIYILNRIGDDFFTTKAEAEAKLAELRGGE